MKRWKLWLMVGGILAGTAILSAVGAYYLFRRRRAAEEVVEGNVSGAPGQFVLPVYRSPVAHSKMLKKIRKKSSALTQHQCMLSQKFKSIFEKLLEIQK